MTLALGFLPQAVTPPEVEIFADGLEVAIEESIPPMAALEDVHSDWVDPLYEKRWTFDREPIRLAAGVPLAKMYYPVKSAPAAPAQPKAPQPRKAAPEYDGPPLVVGRMFEEKQRPSESLRVSPQMRARLEKANAEPLIEEIQKLKSNSLQAVARSLIEEEYGAEKAEALNPPPRRGSAPAIENVAISGHVEMSGGMAFVGGEDRLRVFREYFGEIQEEGSVRVHDGSYRIEVKRTEGTLIAAVFDMKGRVKGEAGFLLSEITPDKVVRGQTRDIHLRVAPVVEGIRAKVLSSYSFAQHEFAVEKASGAFSGAEGVFPVQDKIVDLSGVDRESTAQILAGAPQHWGTSALVVSGQESAFELFSDSRMNALLDQTGVSGSSRSLPVVYGKVESRGSGVAGAVLELAGSAVKPVYFNALLIPDPKQEATSANGVFAFVGVEPGIHQVRAVVHGKVYPTEVFSASPRTVSYVKLQEGTPGWVPLRVYDPLASDLPLASKLKVIGSGGFGDDHVAVDGEALFEVQRNDSLMWIESLPFGKYLMTRQLKRRKSNYLLLPGVSEEWMRRLSQNLEGLLPSRAMVVGFVEGYGGLKDYRVRLGSDAVTGDYKVAYFDPSGELVEKPADKGGFVIFNMAEGMQTVVITPNEPLKAATHVVVAEPQIVSVIQQAY